MFVKSYAGTEAAVCVSFAKKEILEGQLDDVRESSIEVAAMGSRMTINKGAPSRSTEESIPKENLTRNMVYSRRAVTSL